jgi:hypothetical protein
MMEASHLVCGIGMVFMPCIGILHVFSYTYTQIYIEHTGLEMRIIDL